MLVEAEEREKEQEVNGAGGSPEGECVGSFDLGLLSLSYRWEF